MLKAIQVLFKDTKFNYGTSVSLQSDNESINSYFLNTVFNVVGYCEEGEKPEHFQKCIGWHWLVTTNDHQVLKPVIIFNAKDNTRQWAMLDVLHQAVIGLDTLAAKCKGPYYNTSSVINELCNESGLVKDSVNAAFPLKHLHSNVYKLVA